MGVVLVFVHVFQDSFLSVDFGLDLLEDVLQIVDEVIEERDSDISTQYRPGNVVEKAADARQELGVALQRFYQFLSQAFYVLEYRVSFVGYAVYLASELLHL
jgi:hypothetical protein